MLDPDFLKSLASRFGTPLYVYDLAELDKRYQELRGVLPPGSSLFYSLKANPHPTLVAHLRELGTRAEVSSEGELEVALQAGHAPSSVLYTGPAKTQRELANALSRGVTWFSLESPNEYARMSRLARTHSARVEALIRVNPEVSASASLSMTGVSSQFGFEEADAEAFISGADRPEEVELCGVHVYFGTQLKDAEACVAAFDRALGCALNLGERCGRRWSVVDLGGGFPWPFATADAGGMGDLARVKEAIAKITRARLEYWFESGRFLVASSGVLLASVVDVKSSRNTRYVVLDTGTHHLGGMSGLGRLWRPQVSLKTIGSDNSAKPLQKADVVGPLCTPLDCLGKNVVLEELAVGDLVSIPNVGAYGLTASLTSFLSRPAPAEVVCDGQRIVEVQRLRTGHMRID